MDIEQGGLHAPMAGKGGDLVNIPICAGKVRETEVPEGVSRESFDPGASGKLKNDLGPTPDRDRAAMVAPRLGEEERSTLLSNRTPILKITEKQLATRSGVWDDAFAPALGALCSNPECAPRWINVVTAETAKLLAPKTGIIGKRQHDAVANRLLSGCVEDALPIRIVRNPWQLMMTHDQASPGGALSNRAGRTHSFFKQVNMEQANDGQEELDGRMS